MNDQPERPDHYETGRSYSAAEISRRVKGRPRLEPTDDARALAEQLLAEVIQQETDRAAGSDGPFTRAKLRNLANAYRDATRPDPRRDLDDLLDGLAAELSLTDVRALRLAGEAAVAATPRVIKAAKGRGMTPGQIAAGLGLTPSRVYQVLREQAAQEDAATVGEYQLSTTGGHEWHRETPTAGRRCRRCGLPHSQWSGERCTGSNDQ